MSEIRVLEPENGSEYYAQSFCIANPLTMGDIVNLTLQVLPSPAVIFTINDEEVLKLEPGKVTLGNDQIADANAVYERLLAWLVKLESFDKATSK